MKENGYRKIEDMNVQLKEYYFTNVNHIKAEDKNSALQYPLLILGIYGSIVNDPFINTNNTFLRSIIDNYLTYYDKLFSNNIFTNWKKEYQLIVTAEKDVTPEFIKTTIRMSDMFYTSKVVIHEKEFNEQYLLYWDFILILAYLYPPIVLSGVEGDRLGHDRYINAVMSVCYNKFSNDLLSCLMGDRGSLKVKCYKLIQRLQETSNTDIVTSNIWNVDIPRFFSVCLLILIYKSKSIPFREIMYESLK